MEDQKLVDQKLVENGEMVENMLKSDVWQEIVGPELYRRIVSAKGHQKSDGRWVIGTWAITNATNDEMKYAAGYIGGLMEFSNSLLDFIKAKNDATNRLQALQNINDKNDLVDPMMEDYE